MGESLRDRHQSSLLTMTAPSSPGATATGDAAYSLKETSTRSASPTDGAANRVAVTPPARTRHGRSPLGAAAPGPARRGGPDSLTAPAGELGRSVLVRDLTR